MRNIKFRIWDGKKMHLPKIETKFKNGSFWQVSVSKGETIFKEKVEQYSILQFTGLHDKNGKEIYEGDILVGGGKNWQVGWNYDRGCWTCDVTGKLPFYPNLNSGSRNSLEIIGNIYDNPELLSGGEK